MRITVNGEAHDVPDRTTVARLLEMLPAAGGPVAVEVNREIVPRSLHAGRALAPGDEIEIVTLVGGG